MSPGKSFLQFFALPKGPSLPYPLAAGTFPSSSTPDGTN
jgi:hypothetical protein